MKPAELRSALHVAVEAARDAGALMRRHWRAPKTIHLATQHDIKLELDVRCQKRIERRLLRAFPHSAVLGEEGVAGPADAPLRWIVDPIDGTVNFTYDIPHACVSIALQQADPRGEAGFATVAGVVYDPFCDELWTALEGGPARLNGRVCRVSRRPLAEAVVSLGFGKQEDVLNHLLPAFTDLLHRVRKLRIMGSAALALTYVACGRFDAFVETGVRLWDIAAGGFIVERAGGRFGRAPRPGEHVYELNAHNGRLGRSLSRLSQGLPRRARLSSSRR